MEGYFNYITKPFGSNEHLIESHIERDSSKSILKEPWSLYFSQALFMALNFGGVYLRREIRVSKLIGLAWLINGRKFTVFAMFSKYKPPGGLYLEGFIFGILRYSANSMFYPIQISRD